MFFCSISVATATFPAQEKHERWRECRLEKTQKNDNTGVMNYTKAVGSFATLNIIKAFINYGYEAL